MDNIKNHLNTLKQIQKIIINFETIFFCRGDVLQGVGDNADYDSSCVSINVYESKFLKK